MYSILNNGKESDVLEFASGSMLRIKGKNVSFDADDEAQGIFLVASDKSEIRIASYNRIGSSVIEAYIPSGTAAGAYEVKLVTKPGSERYEKCIFSAKLAVTV